MAARVSSPLGWRRGSARGAPTRRRVVSAKEATPLCHCTRIDPEGTRCATQLACHRPVFRPGPRWLSQRRSRFYLRRTGGEGCTEAFQGELVVARGPGFQANRALVAHVLDRACNGGVVDLAGTGLAPPRHVGDLDLADERTRAAHELDQVPFADLGVIQVEH